MTVDPNIPYLFVALLGGGGFVGWFRERRKGKGDEYSRATDWMDRQDTRISEQEAKINELNRVMGELTGRLDEVTRTNVTLKADKEALTEENATLTLENTELKTKIHVLENRQVRHTDPQ